ncbi:MAG: PrsW family intramembrane metalloprotease, partial [Anaerolineaceae bacterium]|nr:PrsW family intramembrane metalloprotease [Anaerolineaceae bacterium]
LIAALVLPSFIFSLQRLRGFHFPIPRINGFRIATIAILLWPLTLVLGSWASTQDGFSWLILPPLLLFAIGLPVWWLIEFARRRLSSGSLQRSWGIINFSLLITNPLVVFVEIVVFFLLLMILVLWVLNQPALLKEFEMLAQKVLSFRNDPEAILPLITPYLQKPFVILGILILLSGLIPAIEELFKPLALWLLVRHRLTPAEGFTAGALCGGSFALLESLLALAGPAQQGWAIVAIGRAGTGLLHITTTALLGWAMARTWQKGSYRQLGLTYLASVALHGLWNALSFLMGMGILVENSPEKPVLLASLVRAAPVALVFLTLFLFSLLWAFNRHLRQPPSTSEPAVFNSVQSI